MLIFIFYYYNIFIVLFIYYLIIRAVGCTGKSKEEQIKILNNILKSMGIDRVVRKEFCTRLIFLLLSIIILFIIIIVTIIICNYYCYYLKFYSLRLLLLL